MTEATVEENAVIEAGEQASASENMEFIVRSAENLCNLANALQQSGEYGEAKKYYAECTNLLDERLVVWQ